MKSNTGIIQPEFNFENTVPAISAGGVHDLSRAKRNNQVKPALFNEYEKVMAFICTTIGNYDFAAIDDPFRIPGPQSNIGFTVRHVYHECTNLIESLEVRKYDKTGGPINGNITVSGTSGVTGAATFNSSIGVTGNTTLSTLSVSGNTTIGTDSTNTLILRSRTSIPNAVDPTTSIRIGNSCDIYQSAANVLTLDDSLNIGINLTVTGTTTLGTTFNDILTLNSRVLIPSALSNSTSLKIGTACYLYEDGAGTLKTDNNIIVENNLTVKGDIVLGDLATDDTFIVNAISTFNGNTTIDGNLTIPVNNIFTSNGEVRLYNNTDIHGNLTVTVGTVNLTETTITKLIVTTVEPTESSLFMGKVVISGLLSLNGGINFGNDTVTIKKLSVTETLSVSGPLTLTAASTISIEKSRIDLPTDFSFLSTVASPVLKFGYRLEEVHHNLAAVFQSATSTPAGAPAIDTDGRFISGKIYNLVWNDIAETVPSDGSYEPGDFVQFIPGKNMTTKYIEGNTDMVIGVCSGEPGFIVGWNPEYPNPRFVALKGMVWIKLDKDYPYGDMYITPSGKICTTVEVLRMPACKRIGTLFEKKDGMGRIFI